MYGQHLGYTKS